MQSCGLIEWDFIVGHVAIMINLHTCCDKKVSINRMTNQKRELEVYIWCFCLYLFCFVNKVLSQLQL